MRTKERCMRAAYLHDISVIIIRIEHVLTPSISYRGVKHLQQDNFVPFLLAQVPPSMRGPVNSVMRLSDISPSDMIDRNQVFWRNRTRVTYCQRPIFNDRV